MFLIFALWVISTAFVSADEAIKELATVDNYCVRYSELDLFRHTLQLICPPRYDDKCDDPIMDPDGLFRYRCQTVFPNDDKLRTIEILNATSLLEMLHHTDFYKRTWCMIALFYGPSCPFSARIAPYFNALPDLYNGSIKFVAFDATEFTKLNSRYGVSGTPTVMLFVSGAAVARMEDRSLNDSGLMSFVYDWTDVTPVFGAPRYSDSPLHIEFDDRPDVFYLSLSLLVAYAVLIYCIRDRLYENARVRNAVSWISARIDALGERFAPQLH
ncbi:hypothetical protein Q1695_005006 [Nippostrongylus brasiliensis]|nr:hypothetical protein Q1695_005006 [Nippostrongylus brasiliensis]